MAWVKILQTKTLSSATCDSVSHVSPLGPLVNLCACMRACVCALCNNDLLCFPALIITIINK